MSVIWKDKNAEHPSTADYHILSNMIAMVIYVEILNICQKNPLRRRCIFSNTSTVWCTLHKHPVKNIAMHVYNQLIMMLFHDDVIKLKHFPCYWPVWRESTGPGWIPIIKASHVELLWFLRCAPEQTVEQTMEAPVIWELLLCCMFAHWGFVTHIYIRLWARSSLVKIMAYRRPFRDKMQDIVFENIVNSSQANGISTIGMLIVYRFINVDLNY